MVKTTFKKLQKQIRTGNDPVLSQVCERIDPSSDKAVSIAFKLKQVCAAFEGGVGLASPQIGEAVRIVFIWSERCSGTHNIAHCQGHRPGFAMINPIVISRSEEMAEATEYCLSYPGMSARISRFKTIVVKYFDIANEPHVETFHDFDARVVQHELDHLDGICQVGKPTGK